MTIIMLGRQLNETNAESAAPVPGLKGLAVEAGLSRVVIEHEPRAANGMKGVVLVGARISDEICCHFIPEELVIEANDQRRGWQGILENFGASASAVAGLIEHKHEPAEKHVLLES